MNRDRARELLPIIQAIADGKTVQERCVGDNPRDWHDWDCSIPMFDNPKYEYRIKPEPREWFLYFEPEWKPGDRVYTTDTMETAPTNAVRVMEVLE